MSHTATAETGIKVDDGPQTPMNTTTVATAVQRRWACHTRAGLSADAYGRQRCNVSQHVLSSTCGVFPGLCARERGQRKQTKNYRYARTK